jgi:phage shock protein A
MSHHKIRAAARKRMAETGEPYAAARRAVVGEHQAAEGKVPSPSAGYALRMSGEIHDWLADLRGSDPPAATRVRRALAALMKEGAGLGDPLIASTAESWPWALAEALDRSYQERLDRLLVVRRGEADAVTLSRDIQHQTTELESAWAELDDGYRRALDAGKPQEAAQAAADLAAVQQQAAEMRRLLPRVMDATRRLAEQGQRLQLRAEAFRVQKEVLKASFTAAESSLRVHKTIASSSLPGDDGGRRPEDAGEEIGAAQAWLAGLTAQMERELGQEPWPEGLTALRPGARDRDDVCILFAAEPPGAALLIAVLEGLDAVAERYAEALLAAAGVLRDARAGQAPEAAAYTYDSTESFLAEFAPGAAGADDSAGKPEPTGGRAP